MRNPCISLLFVLGIAFCSSAGAADFVPSDIAGLQVWFDAADLGGLGFESNPATGTAVGIWADLSDSGLDATQADAARQPIYRSTVAALGYMPAVDFNGTSQGLGTAAFSSGNVRTAFVVTVPRATQSAWPWVVAQIDTAYGANDAWGIGVASATKFRASWRHANGGHGSSNQSTNFVPNVPYVLGYVSDVSANEGSLYVNGSAMTPATTVHQTLDQGLGIGATSGASSYWYNGEIAEVILYDTALNAADRAQVQTYLTQKYWMSKVYYDTSADPGLLGGSATWNGANTLWSSSTAGTDPTAWTPSSDAVFHSSLGPGTITIGENLNVNSVTIEGSAITLANSGGSRLVLAGGLAITAGGSGTVTINAGTLSGTGGLVLDRASTAHWLYDDQTFTGQVQILRGTLRINSLANFGANSSLGQGTPNVPVVLGSAGGDMGALWYIGGNTVTDRTFQLTNGGSGSIGTNTGSITLNGTIDGGSETSTMRLSSQASHVMTLNAPSTYLGSTHIYGAASSNSGIVRLGIDNALPTTTGLRLGFVSGVTQYSGLLDLNGFNQEMTGLVRDTDATSPYINVFNSNTTTQSTLTLNIASDVNTYDGLVGRAGADNLALTKTGEGALRLRGANTYTGATVVSEGTLMVNSLANFGTASSLGRGTEGTPITLGSAGKTGALRLIGATAHQNTNRTFLLAEGATGVIGADVWQINLSGAISGGNADSRMVFDVSGNVNNLIRFNAANTYLGATQITGEAGDRGWTRLQAVDNGLPTTTTLHLGGSGDEVGYFDLYGRNQELAGLVRTSGSTASSETLSVYNSHVTTSTLTLNIAAGITNSYDGTIGKTTEGVGAQTWQKGTNLALLKTGVGRLELLGANSYTGATTIAEGTLVANSLANFGEVSSLGQGTAGMPIVLGNVGGIQGILWYTGSDAATDRTFRLAQGGYGAIRSQSASVTLNGAIDGGSTTSIIQFSSQGSSTMTLNAANSYSGATHVYGAANADSGVVQLGIDNALPTSTSLRLGLGSQYSGLFDLNGHNQQLAGLALDVGATSPNIHVFNGSSATESTLTLNITSGTNTFNGVIGRDGGDNLGLTKIGTGQLQLSGVNTYTGATVIGAGNVRTGVLADYGSPSTFGRGTAGTPIVLGSESGNQGSIWYTGGNVAINRTFYIADGGSGSIAAASGSITLNGAVEGGSAASNMRFSSQGSSTMTLNAVNTYVGTTHIYGHHTGNNGVVRLGIDNALPTTTSLSLGFVSGANQYTGLLDLNGFHQELTGLVRHTGATGPYINVFNSNATTQSTLTLNVASGVNTYDGILGRIGGDNLALVKTGEGALELLRANTYTGTTTVEAGLLSVPGLLANTGPADVFLHSAGTAFGVNDPRIALAVANGSDYGMGSTIVGGDHTTTCELLGGTAGDDRTIAMAWRQAAGGEKSELISDVLSLEGTGDDTYVLQMSYNASWGTSAYLAWLDGNEWVNAVAGNMGGTPTFFEDAYDPASHFMLGNYGVDTTNYVAWAVLNHNSQFAVVPEPGVLLLLAMAGLALPCIRRTRKGRLARFR